MRSESVGSLDNGDVEASKLALNRDEGIAPADERQLRTSGLWSKVNSQLSVEGHGVAPLTEEERTDARFLQCFTLWIGMNGTISAFSTGTLGPLLYGLSFRDTALCIVFFNIFSCAMPAYFAVFGPRLGMRQMAIARYSYGLLGAILPAFLNLVTFIGFCAVNAIAAGQVLAAVNPGSISLNVGIVIIAVISMIISFCGYRILHACERWAWIPVIFSFILLAGFGGRHLGAATAYQPGPATSANILSWASLVIGFSLSWCGCSADFNTYMHRSVSSLKIFFYTFAGLYLPCALIQTLGAAFAAAAMSGEVLTWETAFNEGSVGGLMAEALKPLHGFGKVLLIIFALGMISNNAPTVYAFSLSIQVVFPFLAALPRFLFPVVATAIYLPIAIVGATHFASALSNFLGLIGYWSSIFAAVFLTEHFVFRRNSFGAYHIPSWNSIKSLPPGIAALFSSFCGVAMVVLGMDQVWWRGPIAKLIGGEDEYGGDVAIWLGMAVAALVYLPTRLAERKVFGR
ncbi:NCS cytosine-purine permease [Leucosporidium creatinivorum]|uniref:NCS cytosine-purine permease n=1 Tax=Leucosporidium creatinivorum TaxID=106004 RepID=A0A1Y2FLM6_9BASI|nr:NCS cytosine-purine permease [Leucosporidium creatinivorum]